MNVLLYSDKSPGSGGWCYRETLLEMGLEVCHFGDSEGLEKYRSNWLHRLVRKVLGRLPEKDRQRHLAQLRSAVQAQKPELLIVAKGLYLAAEDVHGLRASGAWVCNINHDDFFSHNRNNWSAHQRGAIPAYHHIFTTREVNVEEVRPLNSSVEFFPFAYYPRIHHPVPILPPELEQWNVDVVFVGTFAEARARLLEKLVHQVPARYAVYGEQWRKLSPFSPLRSWVRHRELHFNDLAKALGGASIALGFLRKENRDDYTQRTFEIPACRGLLLAERTPRHQTFYREGIEAEFFDAESPGELCDKVIALLRDPVRRESIRKAGQVALYRQKHTYRDRLERLLEVFGQWKRSGKPAKAEVTVP